MQILPYRSNINAPCKSERDCLAYIWFQESSIMQKSVS